MPKKFAITAAALFGAVFLFLIITARTLFDAAWFVSLISIPVSSLANLISRDLVGVSGAGQKNVFFDLGLLLILGAAQYWVLGLVVGVFVRKVKGGRPKSPAKADKAK